MERQKAEARKAWSGSGEAATETIWFSLREKLGATEFLGYDTETAEGEIRALVKDGKEVKTLAAGEEGAIIVNQTPFYAESGGQAGDQGVIRAGKSGLFRVTDTEKKAGDLWVHRGKLETGAIAVGDAAALRGGQRATHGDAGQPLGDPSPARGVARNSRPPRRAERLARRP